jgi:hypothetical protein
VDVNAAPRELLLRVPGLGARSVQRIVEARRHRRLRLDDLRTLGAAVRRAMPFVLTADARAAGLDAAGLRARLVGARAQGDLFDGGRAEGERFGGGGSAVEQRPPGHVGASVRSVVMGEL